MYCRWGVQFLFLRVYVPKTRQVDGFFKTAKTLQFNIQHILQVTDTAMLRRVDSQRIYMRTVVSVVQNTYHMPSVLVGLFFPYPSVGTDFDNLLVLP
jgi:hypothetical protein